MATRGSAFQTLSRWEITPLEASPASFHPSNAAMSTGSTSSGSPSSSITPPPLAVLPPSLCADRGATSLSSGDQPCPTGEIAVRGWPIRFSHEQLPIVSRGPVPARDGRRRGHGDDVAVL